MLERGAYQRKILKMEKQRIKLAEKQVTLTQKQVNLSEQRLDLDRAKFLSSWRAGDTVRRLKTKLGRRGICLDKSGINKVFK